MCYFNNIVIWDSCVCSERLDNERVCVLFNESCYKDLGILKIYVILFIDIKFCYIEKDL